MLGLFLEFGQPRYPCVWRRLKRCPPTRATNPEAQGRDQEVAEGQAGARSAVRSPVPPGGSRAWGRRTHSPGCGGSASCVHPSSQPQGSAAGFWRSDAVEGAGGWARCRGNPYPAASRAQGAKPSASRLLRNRRADSWEQAAEPRGCGDAARVWTRGHDGGRREAGSRVGSAPPEFSVPGFQPKQPSAPGLSAAPLGRWGSPGQPGTRARDARAPSRPHSPAAAPGPDPAQQPTWRDAARRAPQWPQPSAG